MRSNRAVLAAVALAAALGPAGCERESERAAEVKPETGAPTIPPASEPLPAPMPEAGGARVGATPPPGQTGEVHRFEPAAGQTGVRGTLVVRPDSLHPDSLKLVASLDGLTPGAHAWHIHAGPCGQEAAPVRVPLSPAGGKPGLGRDLRADHAGTIYDSLTVPAAAVRTNRPPGGQSIRVHARGGADHGPTVACAPL
ncbi:MAG: CHRD domain-containing protein [Gemmatimonadetes bacterium]|nr:CHRD domain-containing protein [Gemmatimonadota bacterium]